MNKNNSRYLDKEKNKEIFNRLKSHFKVRFDKEVLEKWGKNTKSMNNWRKSGIPENELSLLALKENVNYDWLIDGVGEKDKLVIPTPHLAGMVEENGTQYKKRDAREENLCKVFSKVPKDKKEEAYHKAMEVMFKYY
ncbi:MAG: Unknown protein [uncultured Sulfurovum sp.]|uniref:Bacteriophage CI repressor n=1 Tax=uncultured Sulfurovum sp. TaxID=269237 RepID=A0A6S6SP27_9BACT|nr:MAG: Unknown protein [uncultured Sulfurovum sp.]